MTKPDYEQVRRILTKAFQKWAHNSKLSFREVYSQDADIQVLFARGDHHDGNKFDGPGLVLAHAFYPGTMRGGDVHFDADETWLTSDDTNEKGTYLKEVAIHEIGHALGLGHSSDKNAIMYPWYGKHNLEDNVLPDDDKLAIQALYGTKTPVWGVYNPPPTIRTTTTTTTTLRPLVYTHYNTRQYDVNMNVFCNDPRYYYDSRCQRQKTTQRTTTTMRTTARPTYRRTDHSRPNSPKTNNRENQCNMTYDAITIIRRQLFIFRNQLFWRFDNDEQLIKGFPYETKRLWKDLPNDFTHVDAVYENEQQKMVFFIGRRYYIFHSDKMDPGYPRPLTHLGISSNVDKIDAAFIWGPQNKTYLVSGNKYWVIDKDTGRAELDYPRNMSYFKGVPLPIDSAFRDKNGILYFFKNKKYWEFNDKKQRVAHFRGRSSAHKWMNCGTSNEIDSKDENNDYDREVVTLRNHRYPYYHPIEHTTYETLVSSGVSIRISLSIILMFLVKYSLQL